MTDLLLQIVKEYKGKEVEISTSVGKIRGVLEGFDTCLKDTPSGRKIERVYCLRVGLLSYSKNSAFNQESRDTLYVPTHSLVAIGIEK